MSAVRQKEDPWNSIVSGAATGGVLAARAGPRGHGVRGRGGGGDTGAHRGDGDMDEQRVRRAPAGVSG
ncbi:hypothetical protein THAOC_25526, partial [Thalassiosira oceanica]